MQTENEDVASAAVTLAQSSSANKLDMRGLEKQLRGTKACVCVLFIYLFWPTVMFGLNSDPEESMTARE